MSLRALALIALLGAAAPAFADQTYPLVCKTGPGFNFNARTISYNPPNSELIISFMPGAGPANSDGSGLLPGQCSWADRALRAGEYPFICMTFTDTFRADFSMKANGGNSYTGYVIGVGANGGWLTSFATSYNQIYTFPVYNEGPSSECLRDPYL